MIKSWKHKGLKSFFETGSARGIHFFHAKKIKHRLAVIDFASVIEDINFPGFYLHKLKGDHNELWSVRVTGNWRITFEFINGDAYIVNYEDYH